MDVLKNKPTKANLLIVRYAVALLKTDLYFERFYQILSDIGSGPGQPRKAYDQLEEELYLLTEQNRYSEYEYFRQKRSHYVARLQKTLSRRRT